MGREFIYVSQSVSFFRCFFPRSPSERKDPRISKRDARDYYIGTTSEISWVKCQEFKVRQFEPCISELSVSRTDRVLVGECSDNADGQDQSGCVGSDD